jgi:TrwC relaxase
VARVVAAKASLVKGVDLDYMWKSAGAQKDPAYYRAEAEGGKEPPGRWWGPGAEALGFAAGQIVEREPYDLVFGEHLDPRDDTTPPGRPPGKAAAKAASLYEEMLADEPEATAERKHELRNEAGQKACQGPLYFDLTLSFGKSISVFHASLGELAWQAPEAGDGEADVRWSGLLGEMDEMLHAAVAAGFGYF